MQKLTSELARLFGDQAVPPTDGVAASATRVILLPFRKMRGGEEAQHWHLLCEVANALQTELGLPAPAVSVAADDGYGLWLSFAQPIALAQANELIALLHAAYFPDLALDAAGMRLPARLPPYRDTASGKWSAFIHPGMGASFADESGLDAEPPLSGQVALLESLESIDALQLTHALSLLRPALPEIAPQPMPAPSQSSRDGLLLKDATLEDIVHLLHSRNIEPTFRHLLPTPPI